MQSDFLADEQSFPGPEITARHQAQGLGLSAQPVTQCAAVLQKVLRTPTGLGITIGGEGVSFARKGLTEALLALGTAVEMSHAVGGKMAQATSHEMLGNQAADGLVIGIDLGDSGQIPGARDLDGRPGKAPGKPELFGPPELGDQSLVFPVRYDFEDLLKGVLEVAAFHLDVPAFMLTAVFEHTTDDLASEGMVCGNQNAQAHLVLRWSDYIRCICCRRGMFAVRRGYDDMGACSHGTKLITLARKRKKERPVCFLSIVRFGGYCATRSGKGIGRSYSRRWDMRKLAKHALMAAVVACLSTPVFAATVTFQFGGGADGVITSLFWDNWEPDKLNSNTGSQTHQMFLNDKADGEFSYGVLRAPLPADFAGATINSATLTMFENWGNGGVFSNVEVRRINTPAVWEPGDGWQGGRWSETHNGAGRQFANFNATTLLGVDWLGNTGVDFATASANPFETTALADLIDAQTISSGGTTTWDVKSWATNVANGTWINDGMAVSMLNAVTQNSGGVMLWRTDGGIGGLVIDYTPVPEPAALGVVGMGSLYLLRRRRASKVR